MDQLQSIKNIIKEVVKNEIELEYLIKQCVKELIFEHFGGQPWLAEIHIDGLAKHVLKEIFELEINVDKLKIDFKTKCEICKTPITGDNIKVCRDCWNLKKEINRLLKKNKCCGINFLNEILNRSRGEHNESTLRNGLTRTLKKI